MSIIPKKMKYSYKELYKKFQVTNTLEQRKYIRIFHQQISQKSIINSIHSQSLISAP